MTKLFIVGFPSDAEESELVEMFGAYGTVEKATIITDQLTGESQGYGFVDMADQTAAEAAVTAMDGASIDDRVISVRIREEKEPAKKIFSTTHNRSRPQLKKQPDAPATAKKKRPRL